MEKFVPGHQSGFIIISQFNSPAKRRLEQNLDTPRAIHLESPCSKCGGITGKIGAGRKPGESSIVCGACRKFLRWISPIELKALIKGGEA